MYNLTVGDVFTCKKEIPNDDPNWPSLHCEGHDYKLLEIRDEEWAPEIYVLDSQYGSHRMTEEFIWENFNNKKIIREGKIKSVIDD